MNRFLLKLERMIRKIAVPNLMLYITGGMLVMFLLGFLFPGMVIFMGQETSLLGIFSLNRDALFSGQVWRLITYIFMPSGSSPIFILISLYFYYMIGTNLERQWGTARFNLYYLLGMLGTTIAALISGYGTNMYLNYSLFFAFAVLFPNMQVLLFFVIPLKIKYLAYLNAAFFLFSFVVGSWIDRAAILASLLNFFLFFGGDFFKRIREQRKYSATRRNFHRQMNNNRWQ
ncbi:MAG: rhomboid family intramembrane serine protease [Acetanaerobacterium sp.]